jgi:hypothetical protein
MVERLNQVRLEKEEIAKRLSIEKQTEQFIEAEYYLKMYDSAACWKGGRQGNCHKRAQETFFGFYKVSCFEREYFNPSQRLQMGMGQDSMVTRREEEIRF